MHVGLNLLYLLPGVVGGTETYAAGLLSGLVELDDGTRYSVFVNREAADWPLPDTPHVERVVCPVDAASRSGRYRWEQVHLPRLMRSRPPVDVLHSLGYVSPLRVRVPSVVTIHDLNYRAFGDRMPFTKRLMLRLFVEQSARRADRVITVSEFSKREIAEALSVTDERIVVTPHGAPRAPRGTAADHAARRQRLGLARPYVLAFSSATPNKNVPALLEAVAVARRELGMTQQLVLVGHAPATTDVGHGVDPNVRATGYVDADTLAAILDGADLLVFPSLYEGFGLPVLEAMAAGVPVACSGAASLPEVGGDAVAYFDPRSVRDIAATMARLAGDAGLREDHARRGRARAASFTWRRTAEATRDAYRAALARPLAARSANHGADVG